MLEHLNMKSEIYKVKIYAKMLEMQKNVDVDIKYYL
jgi:hypothetical protein